MSKEISYASGTSDKPLLGDTIGNKFDEIASKYPKREAVVSIHPVSYTHLTLPTIYSV